MVLCIQCCCGGVNIRDVNRLVFIGDVCMYSDLNALILNRLKCNYCSSCNGRCVKCKGQINTSAALFCGKGSFCSNRLAVNQNCLAGFLIHQSSLDRILFARK